MSGTDRTVLVDAYWLEGWIRAASVTTPGGSQALERLDRIRRALDTSPTLLPSGDVPDVLAEVGRLREQIAAARAAHDVVMNRLANGGAVAPYDLAPLFDALFPKWSDAR